MIEAVEQFITDRQTEYRSRLRKEEVLHALHEDIWRTRGKVMEIIARRRAIKQEEPLFKGAWLWNPTDDCQDFLIDLMDEDIVETRELKPGAKATSRLELTKGDMQRLQKIYASGAQRSYVPTYKLNKDRPGGGRGLKIWGFFSLEIPTPAFVSVSR